MVPKFNLDNKVWFWDNNDPHFIKFGVVNWMAW